MKSDLEKVARTVICDILEGAAFVFTDDFLEEVPEKGWSTKGITIEFNGAHTGILHMWSSDELLALFAANMLGVEEESTQNDSVELDAGKEVLNMITGLLITELYGTDGVYNLTIPEVIDVSSLEVDLVSENSLWIVADDYPMLFNFSLDQV
ncbi:MAG: chemotaxis protein CheX [Fibrobacterales bacterium]